MIIVVVMAILALIAGPSLQARIVRAQMIETAPLA
jgi:Tfp pilus assembly protein PilE